MTSALAPGVELAVAWRLLSLGFTPPGAETLAEIEALADVLRQSDEGDVADVHAAARLAAVDDLRAQYQQLFGGKVQVSPYEGSYEIDPVRQGRQMSDVAAFYRAFGADAHGPAGERLDHAGCELEFLSFLELKRLVTVDEGDEEGAALLGEITARFLDDHAGRWLPTFFGLVLEATDRAPLHRALAAFGLRVVGDELARRGLSPAPPPRQRLLASVEQDTFECDSALPTAAGTGPSYNL